MCNQREDCWLYTLADLNQNVTFVHDTLLDWIRDITVEYGFDGYRVDTAFEVSGKLCYSILTVNVYFSASLSLLLLQEQARIITVSFLRSTLTILTAGG